MLDLGNGEGMKEVKLFSLCASRSMKGVRPHGLCERKGGSLLYISCSVESGNIYIKSIYPPSQVLMRNTPLSSDLMCTFTVV